MGHILVEVERVLGPVKRRLASSSEYHVEHDAQPEKFDTVYAALWWAVETFTKAGTRGIYPITTLGRVIGVIVAVLGICLFALPTGIIVSGLNEHLKHQKQSSGEEKEEEKE